MNLRLGKAEHFNNTEQPILRHHTLEGKFRASDQDLQNVQRVKDKLTDFLGETIGLESSETRFVRKSELQALSSTVPKSSIDRYITQPEYSLDQLIMQIKERKVGVAAVFGREDLNELLNSVSSPVVLAEHLNQIILMNLDFYFAEEKKHAHSSSWKSFFRFF